MTTDVLSKHVGAAASSATSVALRIQYQGYVTKTGVLFATTTENYKYCIIPHTDFSLGDVIHVVSRATPNVAVIARVNAARTAYTPEVLGVDASTYKDYYYVVCSEDDLCLSSYAQVQSVEKISNALSTSLAGSGSRTLLSGMCYGPTEDITPANILTAPISNKFVHITGQVEDLAHSFISRPILVAKGDIVYLKARMTHNFAAVSEVGGPAAAPVYTPLLGGYISDSTEPEEYQYLVRKNSLIVLSWYVGPNADPQAVDAHIYRTFLSEALTDDTPDLTLAQDPVASSGNILTASSFGTTGGVTFKIDKAYTIAANTTVVIPEGCTLYYRGAGKITGQVNGSNVGKIKFQNTLLKGLVVNNVRLATDSTLANSSVRTSWFCPSVSSGATNVHRLNKLNELISILDCQTLDFDQDFTLECTSNYYLRKLAVDGILLKSNVKYRGNNHTITFATACAAFSTRTYGPSANIVTVNNIELSGFTFCTADTNLSYTGGPNCYCVINLGSAKNVYLHDCIFNKWRGTAVNINYIYDDLDERIAHHIIAPIENIHIKGCIFQCSQVESLLPHIGNGITISNGEHIVIEDCEFINVNSGWPGPIDIEAEVEAGGVVFDDITIRSNSFINCGNRAAVNLAGLMTCENPLTIVQTCVKHILICDNIVTGTRLGVSITSLYPSEDDSLIEILNNHFDNVSLKAVVITDNHNISSYDHLCNITVKKCAFTAALSSATKGDYNNLKSTIDSDNTCSFTGFSS